MLPWWMIHGDKRTLAGDDNCNTSPPAIPFCHSIMHVQVTQEPFFTIRRLGCGSATPSLPRKKTNWQLSIQFLFNFCAKTVIKQTSQFHGSLKDLEFPNKKCCQKIEEPLLHTKPLHIAFQSWSLWEAPPIFCQPRQSFRKIPSGSLPVCTTSDTWKIVQDTFQFMNWVHKSDWIWHWHT